MFDEFLYDLKVARKASGLTQADCAHLLGVSDAAMSRIERGKQPPTLVQVCALSLVHGRTFESLYAELFRQARSGLGGRLEAMPRAPRDWAETAKRERCLARLAQRLLDETGPDYGGS